MAYFYIKELQKLRLRHKNEFDKKKEKNKNFKEFLKYNTGNRCKAQLYIFIHQQWIKKEGLMTDEQLE